MVPRTRDRPTPSGNATAMPAIDVDADSRILEALKIMPPRMTLPMFCREACPRSSIKCRPSFPMLPIVKDMRRENRTIPIT